MLLPQGATRRTGAACAPTAPGWSPSDRACACVRLSVHTGVSTSCSFAYAPAVLVFLLQSGRCILPNSHPSASAIATAV